MTAPVNENIMMPGSKAGNQDVLAQAWFYSIFLLNYALTTSPVIFLSCLA